MDTYFLINPGVYTSDELKLTLILSKMGTRKGIAFSEKWYDKLKNTTLKPEDKTLEKFVEDYNENFNPLVLQSSNLPWKTPVHQSFS